MFHDDWKKRLIHSVKIAAAAVAAIALAGELGLKYSATAGIITVLSIRNTKRETLRSAGNRALAFLCATGLSAMCFRIFGYNLQGFAVYLFLFALLCLGAGWTEAIAMDSVLVTHFMTEGSMEVPLLVNEALLFVIGTSLGILVNLHLRRKTSEFDRLAAEADSQIRGILHRMSLWLPREDRDGYGSDCFKKLEQALEAAKRCAVANYDNALFTGDFRELDYVKMRGRQSVILRDIYENILKIQYLPEQAAQVAALLGQIERDYHRENTVETLLKELEILLLKMKAQQLPVSRDEFEARAILFHILMQLKSLLELKRDYMAGQEAQ